MSFAPLLSNSSNSITFSNNILVYVSKKITQLQINLLNGYRGGAWWIYYNTGRAAQKAATCHHRAVASRIPLFYLFCCTSCVLVYLYIIGMEFLRILDRRLLVCYTEVEHFSGVWMESCGDKVSVLKIEFTSQFSLGNIDSIDFCLAMGFRSLFLQKHQILIKS